MAVLKSQILERLQPTINELTMSVKASFADLPKRRHLSRWALINAWKLAGLTAFVTFSGVFAAVTLSLMLRPIPTYFFPLLSDVSKHQPEAAILHFVAAATTLLFFATTTASILHCHTLRLFEGDRHAAVPVHHAHCNSGVDLQLDDIDLSEIMPVSPPLSTVRRRHSRLFSTRTLTFFLLITLILFSTLQFPGLYDKILKAVRNINPQKLLLDLTFYFLVVIWMLAMCFLIWYFLKLQNIPDRPPASFGPDSSLSPLHSEPNTLPSFDPTSPPPSQEQPQQFQLRLSDRARSLLAYIIVILRPMCLTGQAVCLIKIFGLWLALDTFTISNIRLVRLALLAALAFAEYTAAFFFAFFMTILAVDMRAKAPSPEMILQT